VTHDTDSGKGSLRQDQAQLMFGEGFSFSGYERNPLFLGIEGKRFLDISGVSGIDSVLDGRAGVFADFDNDGDLDVFITNIQGEAHQLFRNNVGQDGRWVRVVVDGAARYGRDAFGTVVRARLGDRTLTKIKSGGSGYLSQHDPRLLFGLGAAASLESLEVTWPDGAVERFAGPFASGGTVLVRPGAGRASPLTLTKGRLPDPLDRDAIAARGLTVKRGERLPALSVGTLGQESATRFDALRKPGRRTLVNVWATWCGPCLKEMRELEELKGTLAAGGIDVIGLNVDTDADADIAAFLRRTGASYTIALGGVPAVEALYATDELTVPMSILLDEDGVIREIFAGWSDAVRRRLLELAGTRSGSH
jgi:thiol-disulfide isomerase/thioredoxin